MIELSTAEPVAAQVDRLVRHGQEEFERLYCETFPRVVFGVDVISMPCTCEDGGGPTHWAAIRNTPDAIEDHKSHEECLAWLREHGV